MMVTVTATEVNKSQAIGKEKEAAKTKQNKNSIIKEGKNGKEHFGRKNIYCKSRKDI